MILNSNLPALIHQTILLFEFLMTTFNYSVHDHDNDLIYEIITYSSSCQIKLETSTLTDHDRPLNKRGKRDAPRMGEILRSEHLIPEAIISSTAARAHATAEAVAKASGYTGKIALNRSLYAAGPEAYLKVLHRLSNDSVRVLVVGHNPGLEELLENFTGKAQIMPTCIWHM